MFFDYLGQLLLDNMPLLLFLILGLGYLLGKIKIKGFEFGPVTGVLLVGMVFGHFGYGKDHPGEGIGFMMFIYSVGLQAGPRFFTMLKQDGLRYFVLALVVSGSAIAVATSGAYFFSLEGGASAGILAGSLTSTTTLAAAQDAIRSGIISFDGLSGSAVLNNIMTSYAITYLFGMVGLILLISLIPRITGVDLVEEARALAGADRLKVRDPIAALGKIVTRAFLVTRESVIGVPFRELFREDRFVTVYKVKRGDDLLPVNEETVLQKGDRISFVGSEKIILTGTEEVGPEIIDADLLDDATETCQIVITRKKATDQAVSQNFILRKYSCILVDVKRLGVHVPLEPHVELQRGDVLTVTGPMASIERMQRAYGHLERDVVETDLLTFALGISAGIFIGSLTIEILGVKFGLGAAGGLLSVGLAIGFLRSIHPTFGRMPGAARYVLMELGMLFFMAAIGLKAGQGIIAALQNAGPALIVIGVFTTTVPVAFGYFLGRKVLNINPVLLLGAIAGAMTSGATLTIINREAQSEIPSLGYTGAYAFANILLTIAGSLILLI